MQSHGSLLSKKRPGHQVVGWDHPYPSFGGFVPLQKGTKLSQDQKEKKQVSLTS